MSTSAKLTDLTRWNRAGLSKFDYVDGDAAVWLEELRIAMLGLYMRDKDIDLKLRQADHWRDMFLKPKSEWEGIAQTQKSDWKTLAPALPPHQESRGRRNERLLKQYDQNTGEYTWEINRAFARALHVLLGHLDAYANEGYLRTASQWDNLRRLAAMVNYQPTPPASAISTIALELKPESEVTELLPGLAMKHTPPEGGAPLIFETLDILQAHPSLNAARAKLWNQNSHSIDFGSGVTAKSVTWHVPEKTALAPGELLVVASGNVAQALTIAEIDHDTDAETADILLSEVPGAASSERKKSKDLGPFEKIAPPSWRYHQTQLHVLPDDVRAGLRQSEGGVTIVHVEDGAGFVKGDLALYNTGGSDQWVEILEVEGTQLVLKANLNSHDEISITPATGYAIDGNNVVADKDTLKMRFLSSSGSYSVTGSNVFAVDGTTVVAHAFNATGARGERGFAKSGDAKTLTGKVEKSAPEVVSGHEASTTRTVSFEGKPPKGLANGDWFAARRLVALKGGETDDTFALQVVGVRVSSGRYHILFDRDVEGRHEETEFHGPMKEALRPVGHNRNPDNAITGGKAELIDIPLEAQALLKPGHQLIISRTTPEGVTEDVLTKLSSVTPKTDSTVEITIDPYDAGSGWAAGDTVFRLNCTDISHGETKGAKTLGSGDGERARQMFPLQVGKISHIPSTSAESGVIPDILITVDGERWEYRDFIDPDAEEAKAWSSTLTEDGNLNIHFRRRLPTGQNNVAVFKHRVGVGAVGSGIPPLSFTKPMKKHRHVDKIHQPFATSGGADREPEAKLREAAPSRLAANGRAVSLLDFERLARRNASVLKARADEVPTPSAMREVLLTIAPAGGTSLTQSLENTLRPAILQKSIPGVRLSFKEFETLPLHLGVTVRADLSVNNKTDVIAAAQDALQAAFALEMRAFGQPVFLAEVMAAFETADMIENGFVTRFDLGPSYDLTQPKPEGSTLPWPKNIATRDGAVAAIYPTNHQIAYVTTLTGTTISGNISIEVEDTQ